MGISALWGKVTLHHFLIAPETHDEEERLGKLGPFPEDPTHPSCGGSTTHTEACLHFGSESQPKGDVDDQPGPRGGLP